MLDRIAGVPIVKVSILKGFGVVLLPSSLSDLFFSQRFVFLTGNKGIAALFSEMVLKAIAIFYIADCLSRLKPPLITVTPSALLWNSILHTVDPYCLS